MLHSIWVMAALGAVLSVWAGPLSAAEMRTVLPGKIIRSLAVTPDRILAGLKGKAPGSALVFESQDGGKTWRGLNDGRSVSPRASDVQAVAALGGVILAGTWKHGLFVSRDGGASFKPAPALPSKDVRGLLVVGGEDPIIYTATARDGVFRSEDRGQSWRSIGPGQDFFWSLAHKEDQLFAVSLEKATYRCDRDAGKWQKIFTSDDAYALTGTGDELVIAAQTGGYHSGDAGETWRRLALPRKEKLSSVLMLDGKTALFGSWGDGLLKVDLATGASRRVLAGTAVIHLAVAGRTLLVGSWGSGLKIVPLSEILR